MEVKRIGSLEWSAQNLNTAHLTNGETIPEIKSIEELDTTSENNMPGFVWPNFDPKLGKKFGRLYNRAAVFGSSGLIPDGWRVPTPADFDDLAKNAGILPLANDSTMFEPDSASRKGDADKLDDVLSLQYAGYVLSDNYQNLSDGMYLWAAPKDDNESVVWLIHKDGGRKIVTMPKVVPGAYSLRLVRDAK